MSSIHQIYRAIHDHVSLSSCQDEKLSHDGRDQLWWDDSSFFEIEEEEEEDSDDDDDVGGDCDCDWELSDAEYDSISVPVCVYSLVGSDKMEVIWRHSRGIVDKDDVDTDVDVGRLTLFCGVDCVPELWIVREESHRAYSSITK